MRPVRVDITGSTDASGNASIPVKLPQTGEWHNVKVALSISGPAEWALLLSGSAVTYGRGRRVTLGPELVQDGETLTVSVSGGPVLAAISGTVSGTSGSPSEITATFTPSPNTIALDTAQPRKLLYPDGTAAAAQTGPSFTAPAIGNTNKTFTLPAGSTDIRIGSVVSGGLTGNFTTAIFVVGVQTGIRYFPKAGTGAPFGSRQPITIPVDVQQDRQVQVQVSPDGVDAMDVYVSALFAIEAIEVYAQEPLPVTLANAAFSGSILIPAPAWQFATIQVGAGGPASQSSPSGIGTARTLLYEAVFTCSPGAGRVFQVRVWDGPSGGTLIGVGVTGNAGAAAATTPAPVIFHRLVSSPGNSITCDFNAAAAAGEFQAISINGDLVQ